VEAISTGLRTVRAAGKNAGLLCLDESQVPHYVDCGANFVGVGVDTLLLGNSARALVALYDSDDDGASSPAGY
jgi:4-hydroxy-2-oxoheptanedioate aldolase